jgi:hypothetical protein
MAVRLTVPFRKYVYTNGYSQMKLLRHLYMET